jgi:REP element-mobilizing transposase RayT
MPRRLRYLPANGLAEVTSRTIQGRLLLQPTHRVAELCRGVLARAVRRFPVELHAFIFLGNHYHLLLTAPDARHLAAFMNFLNSNLAREVGRAVRWREKFWGRRYQAIPVSDEEPAQVERLVYLLRHGCKEGLVRRPCDWPGASSIRSLLTGLPTSGPWIDRTSEYRANLRGRRHDPRAFVCEESFELAPLPCWKGISAEEYRSRMKALVREVERQTAKELSEAEREPLGAERAARQNPHDAPARSKKGPAPGIHAATREVRLAFRETYRQFVNAYRRASEMLRSPSRLREQFGLFPPGSFLPPGPYLPTA